MISQQVANSTYNWSVGLILERTKKYCYLFYQLLFFETLCLLTIERGGKNSIAIIFLCFRDWSSTYQQGHISSIWHLWRQVCILHNSDSIIIFYDKSILFNIKSYLQHVYLYSADSLNSCSILQFISIASKSITGQVFSTRGHRTDGVTD